MKIQALRHYSGIGGQAVLEGVMMRNKDQYAVSVRRENGEIATDVGEFHGLLYGSVFRQIPFLRGIFVFLDSLSLGYRSLNYASSIFTDEETHAQPSPHKASAEKTETDKNTKSKAHETLFGVATFVLSLAIALILFTALPFLIASLFSKFIRSDVLLSLLEGALRIFLFIVYIRLIAQMEDTKRLFAYHGAEHKCINCLESGHALNVANVRRASRLHRRCGSSFLLFVMLVSIVLFFFIRVRSVPYRILIRILLIPLISGISYELILLAANSDFILWRLLAKPGLMLQRLTTREPDDSMIEVGIRSVEAIFDWRSYLQDAFGIIRGEEESSDQSR